MTIKAMELELIRNTFGELLTREEFVVDKSGSKMLEMVGASFYASEPTIFGEPNYDYIDRELQWYASQSLNVNDIPGETPKIWKQVADANGAINSNYGWCIFSGANGFQYQNVLKTLKDKPDSRQGVMVYTRPSMHTDAFDNGRSDFMCTNAVQYILRNNTLYAIVQMRSNDVVFGYRNDAAWQWAVLQSLAKDLEVPPGMVVWQVGSLHVYERDFWRVDAYNQTGDHLTKKSDYERSL